MRHTTFGLLDKRFLAQSLGLLNPPVPISVDETDSVRVAIDTLKKHRVGCVTVTDKTGSLRGIFSERDAILKADLESPTLASIPVSTLMTKDPHTAEMTTQIAFALTMMSQGGFRHIPIVDDTKMPVGIISVRNIIDYFVSTLVRDLEAFKNSDPGFPL